MFCVKNHFFYKTFRIPIWISSRKKKDVCVCARVCVWEGGGVAVAVDTLYLIPDSHKWSADYSFVTYIGASACNVLMTAPVYLEL